jgi:hypothetical protein
MNVPTTIATTIPISRLQHLAGQIHGLGPRPLFELLQEIDNGADFGAALTLWANALADIVGCPTLDPA